MPPYVSNNLYTLANGKAIVLCQPRGYFACYILVLFPGFSQFFTLTCSSVPSIKGLFCKTSAFCYVWLSVLWYSLSNILPKSASLNSNILSPQKAFRVPCMAAQKLPLDSKLEQAQPFTVSLLTGSLSCTPVINV